MRKKASTPIDWAVGAVFFIFAVAVTFYYADYSARPKQPYEIVLRNAGSEVAGKIAENVSWVVAKAPAVIYSNSTADRPVQIQFFLPDSANESTFSVTDSAGSPYARIFQDGNVLWSAPVSTGKTVFYLRYSPGVSLSEYDYPTDISVSGERVNNSLISANFSSTGQKSMVFGAQEFFYGSGMALGTASSPQIANNTVYADINYSDGVSLRIYSNIPKVVAASNHTIDATIFLDTNFTKFYADGTVYSFPAGSFNGVTDFVDAYNESGLAVIGDSINFSVSDKGSYREIALYNVTGFEIYAHYGNYTNATDERDAYFDNLSYIIGVPEEIKGVSEQLFSGMSSIPHNSLKESMGIFGVDFLVLFNETEDYASIPSDRGVIVVKHPVSVLDRFGRAVQSYVGVAVWLAN